MGFQRHDARVMAYLKGVCAILGWACLNFHGEEVSSSEIWALIGSMVREKSHLASSEKTPSKGMWVVNFRCLSRVLSWTWGELRDKNSQ